MNSLVDDLIALRSHVDKLIARGARKSDVHLADDGALVDALARAGDVGRLVEALMVELVGELQERSRSLSRDERLTTRMGCRNVSELVQRLTRSGAQTAARLERAAKATAPAWDSITGDAMPARLPAMREALLDGEVGVDGVLAVAGPLSAMLERVDLEQVLIADRLLADAARGESPDRLPPACADLLRVQAQVWAAVLDPDGAEPDEQAAARRRGITLGLAHDGVIPIRGALLPEVAAQLQRIYDSTCSPHAVRFHDSETSLEEPLPDERTLPQKLHDALATALTVAAASKTLPSIGGAAPTLVVSVRQEDLTAGTGRAWAEGCDEPVSIFTARHIACSGVIQRITLDDTGRVVRLGIEERVFNRHQRRAIALRDGGCIIPGCRVQAGWCEIHHVTPHAHGGPTRTDDGVLLCWHHHRFIDTGPWRIRMNRGVPEVQARRWYDPTGSWRAVTTSRTRMLDLTGRRT